MATVSAKNLRTLPPGRHLIESGLYLVVRGKSRKYFLRYSLNGRRRDLALGDPATKTLTVVKQEAARCRALIAQGIDPKEERDKARKTKSEKPETFGEFFERVFPVYLAKRHYKKNGTDKMYRAIIETYGIPILRDIPVRDLRLQHIRACLDPIWEKIPFQARKLSWLLEHLLNLARIEGIHEGQNPAQWRGNLEAFYPRVRALHPVRHREALAVEELRDALRKMLEHPSLQALAIALVALCASRVSEIKDAKWDEVDFSTATLSIPPERRKDGKPFPHRVPLSRQAMKIFSLAKEKTTTVSPFIFPGISGRALNRGNFVATLKKYSRPDATMHGLRSTFRDWAAETGVQDALAEKQLMHAYGSVVVQAYQRSDLLEQRRPVMQQWADEILPYETLDMVNPSGQSE